MVKNGNKLFLYLILAIIVSLTSVCGSLQACEAASVQSKARISFTDPKTTSSEDKNADESSTKKKLPQTNEVFSLSFMSIGGVVLLFVCILRKKMNKDSNFTF